MLFIQPLHASNYPSFPLNKILEFPRDHGAHFDFPFEWWYFTGHLHTSSNKKFGFELTFFRLGMDPLQKKMPSAWKINNLYVTHFALTSPEDEKFFHRELLNRDSLSLAGAEEKDLHLWNGNWFGKRMQDGSISLYADAEKYKLSLVLAAAKPLLLQGEKGYSQKGPDPRHASYYYSFPLLKGKGTLMFDGKAYTIDSSSVWMDHEFFSEGHRNKMGWEWFGIQLANNEQITIFQLHDPSHETERYSAGLIYKANGEIIHLKHSDFQIQTLSTWRSGKTNIEYSSGWKITIPRYHYDLSVQPVLKNQEVLSSIGNYWEGKSAVTGKIGAQGVTGDAYVEINPLTTD